MSVSRMDVRKLVDRVNDLKHFTHKMHVVFEPGITTGLYKLEFETGESGSRTTLFRARNIRELYAFLQGVIHAVDGCWTESTSERA